MTNRHYITSLSLYLPIKSSQNQDGKTRRRKIISITYPHPISTEGALTNSRMCLYNSPACGMKSYNPYLLLSAASNKSRQVYARYSRFRTKPDYINSVSINKYCSTVPSTKPLLKSYLLPLVLNVSQQM